MTPTIPSAFAGSKPGLTVCQWLISMTDGFMTVPSTIEPHAGDNADRHGGEDKQHGVPGTHRNRGRMALSLTTDNSSMRITKTAMIVTPILAMRPNGSAIGIVSTR